MFNFTNLSERPNYLLANDFDRWFDCFNNLIVTNFRLTSFRLTTDFLSIEFSNELKRKSCGSYSVDEIKDLIKSKWKTNNEINSILDEINSYGDYQEVSELLAGRVRDNNANTDYHDIRDEIDGMFDNIYYTYDILGEYNNYHKKIILYTLNIEKYALDNLISNKQAVEDVFIHELFHAYHYKDDEEELIRRYDYTSRVVKESLASYFEYCYCQQHGISSANSIKDSWRKNPIWTYPYSGANNIYDIAKFKDIYKTSLVDMDNALRTLLYADDFYSIKNAVTVREKSNKTIAKPNFYKINQSRAFNMESIDGYIFANGNHRYDDMRMICRGDILLHIFGGELHAISIANSDCYTSNNSHGRGEHGIYVDTNYFIFNTPVNISQFINDPSYAIRRNEPYIRLFNYPDFIRLIFHEAKRVSSNSNALITLLETML